MSGDNTPVQEEGDRTVPSWAAPVAVTALCVFGIATLRVISVNGGSISVSGTALVVTVNAPQ